MSLHTYYRLIASKLQPKLHIIALSRKKTFILLNIFLKKEKLALYRFFGLIMPLSHSTDSL